MQFTDMQQVQLLHEQSKATICKYVQDSTQFLDKGRQCRKKVQNVMKLDLNSLPKLKPQFT